MTEWTNKQTTKWLRRCRLLIGKDGDGNVDDKGLSIEHLRIRFEIIKTIYRTPNVATILVYNLTDAHEKQIMREFNDLVLQVGYQGDEHLVFRGNVRFCNPYLEAGNRICEINASDGDKDFRGALVNFALGPDHTDADVIRGVQASFRATMQGHVHGKNLRKKRSRGRAFVGNARDILDTVALNNDAEWSIQDGRLVLVPVDSTLPDEAIAISSETGLLGAPEVNDKGITIKTMLDPRYVPGGKVWLLNNEVKMRHLKPALTGQKRKLKGPAQPARTDPDGIYKIYAVHHTGDNRGQEWVSEIKCVALDSPIPSVKGMPQSTTPDGDLL